jgi:hypothetical protein
VVDSLAGGAPLARAVVRLDPGGLTARSDALGIARFEGLPTGVYTLRLTDHDLAAIGMEVGKDSIRVTGSPAAVTLSTPPTEIVHRRLCGNVPAADVGVLFGATYDSDFAGVPRLEVAAFWQEAILRPNGIRAEIVAAADTTNDAGGFVLCGIPRGGLVALRAGTAETGAELLEVGFRDRGLLRLDIAVGPAARRATIAGRVVDEAGVEIEGAVVVSVSFASVGTRTDHRGAFLLEGAPGRGSQLRVRKLGYEPRTVTLAVTSDRVETGTLVLRQLPPLLAEVIVSAAPISANRLAFEQRMRSGRGTFLTDSQVSRMPRIGARELVVRTTGLRSTPGPKPRLMMARDAHSSRPCQPVYFLDGSQFGSPFDGAEEEAVLRLAKRIEIYKYDEIPMEYLSASTCGLVFIWTY